MTKEELMALADKHRTGNDCTVLKIQLTAQTITEIEVLENELERARARLDSILQADTSADLYLMRQGTLRLSRST
jgi:hypothetical protein